MKLTKPVLKNINEMFISNDDKNVKLAKTMLINNDFDLEDFLEYFVVIVSLSVKYTVIDIVNKIKNSLYNAIYYQYYAHNKFDNFDDIDIIIIYFNKQFFLRVPPISCHQSILKTEYDEFKFLIKQYNLTDVIKSFKIKD